MEETKDANNFVENSVCIIQYNVLDVMLFFPHLMFQLYKKQSINSGNIRLVLCDTNINLI